jgi:hypothetical protein
MRKGEARRKRLCDAYFGPLSADAIATANKISRSTLQRIWTEEKAAGRLAAVPRPNFLDRVRKPIAADEVITDLSDEIDDDLADVSDDGSPIGAFNPTYRAQCDASLAALRAHHTDITDKQIAPASWLAFDRKGAVPPTHAQLMAMCRAYDQRKAV